MYYRIKQLTLLAGDLSGLIAGMFVALIVRHAGLPGPEITRPIIVYISILFVVAVAIMFITGLYDIGRCKNNRGFFAKIAVSATAWTLLSIIFFYIKPANDISPKTTLILITLFGFSFVSLWRWFYNRFISTTFLKTNVLFAGITPEALELMDLLSKRPELGYHVLGSIVSTQPSTTVSLPEAATIGELIQQTEPPEIIVIAPHLMSNTTVLTDVYKAIFQQTSIVALSDFYEHIFGRVPPFTFSEAWFITNLKEQQKKMYDRVRILFDYVGAVCMAFVFILTFPFVAAAIKLSSPGPIFFKQTRVGRGETLFEIIKYRTMRALAPNGSAEVNGPQFASVGDQRITRVGNFLRQTRIDELPQFLNIFRGEMGLIGPRPERPEFVEALKKEMPFYALRHLIKPGLTGWAQLHQSYYGTISENLFKLQYDLYYVKHRNPLLDLGIVLKTINVVLRFMGR